MKTQTSKKHGQAHKKARLTDGLRSTAPLGLLPSCLRGVAATLICCVVLLFAASAIVYSLNDPNRYVIPAALTILYVSCFLGGLVSAKCNKGGALVCGLAVAGMVLLPMLAISPLLDPSLSSEHSLPLAVGLRGIAVVFSVLGAFAGSGERKKTKNKFQKSRHGKN